MNFKRSAEESQQGGIKKQRVVVDVEDSDEDDLEEEEDYEGEDGEGEEDFEEEGEDEEEDEEDYDSDESSDVEYVQYVQQQPQVPQEPRIEDFGGETIPDCCQEHYGLLVIGEVLDDKKVKQLKKECCRDVYSGFHRFGLRWYKFRLYRQMYGKDGVRAKCMEILGVSEDSNENQIKVAYLKMARKWHPDKNPNQSEEDAAQFKKILKAYETLVGKRGWYTMHDRTGTSRFASHFAGKHQEDLFWLESDKSSVWYSVDVSKSDSNLQLKYVEMFEDHETKEFIKSAVVQADDWLVQTRYNIVKSVMVKFNFTKTDINGYLQRGIMFVISNEQFKLLLSHANIHFQEKNLKSKMIDLGAGDGNVTIKFSNYFKHIYATETSKPMKKLLKAKNVKVLPIEKWSSKHKYDFISCLNLLDRCENPQDIIEEMKKSLKPNGMILIALVLPFKPFVEVRNSRQPNQLLSLEGSTFIEQAQSFVKLMTSLGFKLESWTRLPYLCEGDLVHSVYYLDDAVFLFKKL